jgi:eukaryotic-like serine/threonine-protein kinase
MRLAGRGASAVEPKVPLPVPEGHLLAGKYRIEKVIGAGGMGVVASAIHIHLGQRVAIKFLLPHAALDDQTVARFAREARALARIESEHVGRVIDVGSLDSGDPYTVLECLTGRNLAELVRLRGALEIGEAVGYVIEACHAMTEAHSLGIIHRDLKPENLFLADRADGSRIVKVIDFGVSKIEADATGFDAPWVVTSTSAIIGSPLYMSPEQLCAARDVDARTDIWSLGVTLYELLTGQGPFRWSTLPELCAAILKDPPRPLRELRPDAPKELEAVVMSCLEREPSRRPPSAAVLAQELRPFSMIGATTSTGSLAPVSVVSSARSLHKVERSPMAVSAVSSETMASAIPRPSDPPALPPAWLADLNVPTGMTTVSTVPTVRPRAHGSLRTGLLLLGGLGLGIGLLLTGSRADPPSIKAAASTPTLAGGAVARAPSAIATPARPVPRAALEIAASPPTPKPTSGRPSFSSYPQSAFDHRK